MEDTRSRWDRAFQEAVDFDIWGQVEEATDGYQRLQVAAAAEYLENVLELELKRRYNIGRLAAVLKLRVKELQGGTRERAAIGLDSMKSIRPYMKQIIVSDAEFPIHNINIESVLGVPAIVDTLAGRGEDDWEGEELEDEGAEGGRSQRITSGGGSLADRPSRQSVAGTRGTLRGRPIEIKAGDRLLTIFVEKWGFKEPPYFTDPQVVVSVRDVSGDVIEAVQETPTGTKMEGTGNYVIFNSTVFLQTPINRLGRSCAIFLEFRHYKTDKKKKSVKCYCFLEMDEIRPGPLTLEVYKKPAIYKRNKNPSLLSVKPFYLHVELAIETVT